MWVYEEECQGRKLTDVINETHENPKYLPGFRLGDNVVACPSLADTVAGADVVIFCAPHQFLQVSPHRVAWLRAAFTIFPLSVACL